MKNAAILTNAINVMGDPANDYEVYVQINDGDLAIRLDVDEGHVYGFLISLSAIRRLAALEGEPVQIAKDRLN